MLGFEPGENRPSIVAATLKTVAAIGLMSWLAAGWLSNVGDKDTLTRLAANVSRGSDDPLTTGSVGARADATRLDPCTGRPRR